MTTTNPLEIAGIDHVVLRVRDIDAALAFYRDVLGLPIERQLDIGLVQLRAGAALIDLVPVDSPLGRGGGGGTSADRRKKEHFALTLEQFDAAALCGYLDRHGIAHGEVAQRYGALGHGPSLYVTDPDGNTVELKGPATDFPTAAV
jgi:catechol 2,3-dioxygenase-like lactoylglutathione lyase family enzyme